MVLLHRGDGAAIHLATSLALPSAGRVASVWCVFFGCLLSFQRKLFQLSAVVYLSLSLPLFGSFVFLF
jgi:hypothetical protein